MLEKVKAGWNVLQMGQEVADPAKWKMHQISANAIAALIMALVYAAKVFFNLEVPIDQDSAVTLGGGILVAVNVLLTMATSKKIGLPPKRETPNDPYVDADKPRNDRIDYDGAN